MGSSMPKPRCGFCDGHHTPVDFDAASVAASRGVAIHWFPSFSGLLTRVEVGHRRIRPPGRAHTSGGPHIGAAPWGRVSGSKRRTGGTPSSA